MESHNAGHDLRRSLERLEGAPKLSWPERVALAREVGERLRLAAGLEAGATGARVLGILATDEKWEVRQAAAESLLHLQDNAFDGLVAKLSLDANMYVRTAAERTLARRKNVARADADRQRRLEAVIDEYEWFVGKYGQATADRARRIGERYFEVLAGTAAHELRGVLTALKGSLDALAAQLTAAAPSREARALLDKARERAEFLERILTDMKGYSQRLDCEFRSENLAEIVKEALDLVKDEVAPTGRSLAEVEVVNRTPVFIFLEASRHQMIQALAKVVKNAFEAVEKGGKIEIETTLPDEKLVGIVVRDNGVGLSPEDVQDAFTPFVTTKKNVGGTGFGLPIARKIVEAHGGSITITPNSTRGSTVTILLPRLQEDRLEP